MTEIYKKARESFYAELITEGDFWRILRKSTLIDLIKVSFFYFKKDNNETHLLNILNYALKTKLLSRIKTIELQENIDELYKKFNQESELILREYDLLFKELEPSFEKYSTTNLYNLNQKIQYLKVVNEIKVEPYEEEIFDEIIGIIYNILKN